MIVPIDFTHLGYDFNAKVGLTKRHSGVDLNHGPPDSDRGMEVKCMADGEVVFSRDTGSGWGNLIVVWHPKYKVWSRYAHLERRYFDVGAKVKEGEVIALVGSTGGSWSPHLHWDVIIKELPTWTKYTAGWSKAKVEEYYAHPLKYVAEINKREDTELPIVKWNKENNLITQWSAPPTAQEIQLGWLAYKLLEKVKNNETPHIKFDL